MTMSDRLMSIANMTKGVMSDRDAEMLKELSPLEKTELNEFRKKLVGMPTRGPDRTIDQPTSDVETSRLMNFIRGMGMGVGSMADKPDAKTMSMPTRSPDGSIVDRLVKSTSDMIRGIPSDFDVQQLLKSLPKTKDKSITTTEKQVTMSDPDMFDELYQLYENEVRKGYQGSFNDFLIDRREADVDVPVAGQFEDQLMKSYEAAVEGGYKGSFYDFLIDQMDPEFDPAESIRVSRLAEQMRGIPSAMDIRMLRKMITG